MSGAGFDDLVAYLRERFGDEVLMAVHYSEDSSDFLLGSSGSRTTSRRPTRGRRTGYGGTPSRNSGTRTSAATATATSSGPRSRSPRTERGSTCFSTGRASTSGSPPRPPSRCPTTSRPVWNGSASDGTAATAEVSPRCRRRRPAAVSRPGLRRRRGGPGARRGRGRCPVSAPGRRAGPTSGADRTRSSPGRG